MEKSIYIHIEQNGDDVQLETDGKDFEAMTLAARCYAIELRKNFQTCKRDDSLARIGKMFLDDAIKELADLNISGVDLTATE